MEIIKKKVERLTKGGILTMKLKETKGITLIALVVTIALNCYRVAMELMLK